MLPIFLRAENQSDWRGVVHDGDDMFRIAHAFIENAIIGINHRSQKGLEVISSSVSGTQIACIRSISSSFNYRNG